MWSKHFHEQYFFSDVLLYLREGKWKLKPSPDRPIEAVMQIYIDKVKKRERERERERERDGRFKFEEIAGEVGINHNSRHILLTKKKKQKTKKTKKTKKQKNLIRDVSR